MWLERVRSFVDAGGSQIMWAIFVTTGIMWTLIVERLLFFSFALPREIESAVGAWRARVERTSWHAQQIRALLISRVAEQMRQRVQLIKSLIAVCPLLGLLGTVVGMLEVFGVMAIAGNSNPRAMAAGVSQATITTMAGLVAALSGLYFGQHLPRRIDAEVKRLGDLLSR